MDTNQKPQHSALIPEPLYEAALAASAWFAKWRAAAPQREAKREARQAAQERRRAACQSCYRDMPDVRPVRGYQACSEECAADIYAHEVW